jgi:hypothetical protein
LLTEQHIYPFKARHFQCDINLWAVRWYCKYGISYRELQRMLAECGVNVDHSTIYRWVQHYEPEIEKRLRWYWQTLQGSAPGISMKLISELMADGLNCTVLLTSKAAPPIFILPNAETAKRHTGFWERF